MILNWHGEYKHFSNLFIIYINDLLIFFFGLLRKYSEKNYLIEHVKGKLDINEPSGSYLKACSELETTNSSTIARPICKVLRKFQFPCLP